MEEIRIIDEPEQTIAGVRQRARMDQLPDIFDMTFQQVAAALMAAGVTPAGAPYARYRGTPTDTVDVEIGFPVAAPFPSTGELVVSSLPAVRAVETVHVGSYASLKDAYRRVEAFIAERGLSRLDQSWEFYDAGPDSDPDPATWRTRVVFPLTGPQVTA